MTDTGLRHRLMAILAADAAGYSRLMADDEHATVAALDGAREVFAQQVQVRQGRIVDTAGDSVLAVFESSAGAVDAALAIQQELEAPRADVRPDRRLRFRIGVHLGDVIEKADGTVYGNGVNVAARLQTLAEPGAIWVSDAVRSTLGGHDGRRFEDQGRHTVKNIAEPVHVFRMRAADATSAVARLSRPTRRKLLLVAGVVGGGLLVVALWRVPVWPWREGGDAGPLPMSLVIAPIVAPTGDAPGAEIAGALRRDLTAGLAQPGFHITVLQATQGAASGNAGTPAEQASRVRARYVVAGELRRDGANYLAQLAVVEADSGVQKASKQMHLNPADKPSERAAALRELTSQIHGIVWDAEAARILGLPVERLAPIELVMRADTAYDTKPNLQGIDEALRLTDLALALNPNFVPALTSKAHLLVNRYDEVPSPDHERVAHELDSLTARTLALDPRDPVAWHRRAFALLFLGRWAAARQAIDKRVELDPYSPGAFVAKSEVLIYVGQAAQALKVLDADIVQSSGHSWAPVLQCKAHMLLGQTTQAIDACEKAIGLDPSLWSAHLFLAAAQANLGDLAKARAALKAVDQMSPGQTVERMRAHRKAANPDFQRQAETYFYAGLLKAGMPVR